MSEGKQRKGRGASAARRKRKGLMARIPATLSRLFSGLGWVLDHSGLWDLAADIAKAIAKRLRRMRPRQCLCLVGVALAVGIALWFLFRPPHPPSPITVWFSPMEAGSDPNSYLAEDTNDVIDELVRNFDGAFDARSGRPEASGTGARCQVLNVLVGCYRVKDAAGTDSKELRTAIPKLPDGAEKREPYETLSKERFLHDAAESLRRDILHRYRPVGTVLKVAPPDGKKQREIRLGVGRQAGVLPNDLFEPVPSNMKRLSFYRGEIEVLEVADTESDGLVSWDANVEVGGLVQWKRAGR